MGKFYLVAGCLISTIGDLLVKKGHWIAGTVVYTLSIPFWVMLIRGKSLAISAVEWSVLGTMLTVSAGALILGEILTAKQWMAIVLGLVCLAMI